MSDQLACPSCGRPVNPGQMMCECGHMLGVEMPGVKLPSMPSVKLPNVGLKGIGNPSIGLPPSTQPVGSVPGLVTPDIGNLHLDFSGDVVTQGRAYRPLVAIGQKNKNESLLNMPFGITQLSDGSLYVIDFVDQAGRSRVQHFSASGEFLRIVREFEVGNGPDEIDTPAGIATGPGDSFIIADMGASCIKQFDTDGQLLGTWGSEGLEIDQLNSPQDICLDGAGNRYIADTGNNRILEWGPQGECLLVLGINQPDDEGAMLAGDEPGEFDEPYGVTVDSVGNVIVADTANHRIQKFDAAGSLLCVFGSEGEDAGSFYYPNQVAVGVSDDMYVSDREGARIQKFDRDGNFAFQIMLPQQIGTRGDFDVDLEGNLLITLRGANLILKIAVQ